MCRARWESKRSGSESLPGNKKRAQRSETRRNGLKRDRYVSHNTPTHTYQHVHKRESTRPEVFMQTTVFLFLESNLTTNFMQRFHSAPLLSCFWPMDPRRASKALLKRQTSSRWPHTMSERTSMQLAPEMSTLSFFSCSSSRACARAP